MLMLDFARKLKEESWEECNWNTQGYLSNSKPAIITTCYSVLTVDQALAKSFMYFISLNLPTYEAVSY